MDSLISTQTGPRRVGGVRRSQGAAAGSEHRAVDAAELLQSNAGRPAAVGQVPEVYDGRAAQQAPAVQGHSQLLLLAAQLALTR